MKLLYYVEKSSTMQNQRILTGVIRGFCLEAEPNSAEDDIATEEKLPCGRLLLAWAVPGVNVLLE